MNRRSRKGWLAGTALVSAGLHAAALWYIGWAPAIVPPPPEPLWLEGMGDDELSGRTNEPGIPRAKPDLAPAGPSSSATPRPRKDERPAVSAAEATEAVDAGQPELASVDGSAVVDEAVATAVAAPPREAGSSPEDVPVPGPAGTGVGAIGESSHVGKGRDANGLVQARVDEVARLIAWPLARKLHRSAQARVEFAVNAGGYVAQADFLERTGVGAFDREVEAVLHLAEPYPTMYDHYVVRVEFNGE